MKYVLGALLALFSQQVFAGSPDHKVTVDCRYLNEPNTVEFDLDDDAPVENNCENLGNLKFHLPKTAGVTGIRAVIYWGTYRARVEEDAYYIDESTVLVSPEIKLAAKPGPEFVFDINKLDEKVLSQRKQISSSPSKGGSDLIDDYRALRAPYKIKFIFDTGKKTKAFSAEIRSAKGC